MAVVRILFLVLLTLAFVPVRAGVTAVPVVHTHDTLRDSVIVVESIPHDSSHSEFKKEKLIAAVLAFPVPFGFCGLHRIYLGSEPWVPVAYLVTGGGGFGILPLLDFIFIVSANEEQFKAYENNPNFFMWIK